ncbi:hypothetical protein AMTRI_Chr07g28530 [Amborella trichopoda]
MKQKMVHELFSILALVAHVCKVNHPMMEMGVRILLVTAGNLKVTALKEQFTWIKWIEDLHVATCKKMALENVEALEASSVIMVLRVM